MLVTQRVIDDLADRIERAYRLRRPGWQSAGTTPGAWTVAASTLSRLHEQFPETPLDPELFVASQEKNPPFPDPWVELTQPDAVRRYLAYVRRIVRTLRTELTAEVALAERLIGQGESVHKVLTARAPRLSHLGRFVVAQRAGRPALARRFLTGAIEQHRSCPLYRPSCDELLAPGLYPEIPAKRAGRPTTAYRRVRPHIHLN